MFFPYPHPPPVATLRCPLPFSFDRHLPSPATLCFLFSLSPSLLSFLSISILHPMFRSSRYTPPFFHFFPLLLSRLCSSFSMSSSSRNGGIGKENESYIYIYTLLFSLPLLFFHLFPSGRDYLNSTVFHSLFHSLPPSLPSVPLLVFSAPPHNTRAIASYRIAGTSLSILPYI